MRRSWIGWNVQVNGTQERPDRRRRADGLELPSGYLPRTSVSATLPVDYNVKYISFNNAAPTPTPWVRTLTAPDFVSNYHPLGTSATQPFSFVLPQPQTDDECASGTCIHAYFNTQPVVLDDSLAAKLRGNMQAEYR